MKLCSRCLGRTRSSVLCWTFTLEVGVCIPITRMVGTVAILAVTAGACASRAPRPVTTETTANTTRIGNISGGSSFETTSTTTADVTKLLVPASRTWEVLPAVYQSLEIPLGFQRQETMEIGTEGFRVRRRLHGVSLVRYLNCGESQSVPNAETYEVMLAVSTRVTRGEQASVSTAATYVQATARSVQFASGDVACTSTGALEKRINQLLTERVRG